MQRILDLFISINCSTCFRRFFRPSSGAQNCTYSVRYCQTNTAACCYRGWDGTYVSINCSTCFRRFLRPSSGAQNCTYSVRHCQTNTAACCYRGWHRTYVSINCSTCFRRFLRPSSRPQNCTYSVRYCQTNTAAYCYRGWDGTYVSSISSTIAAGSSIGLTMPDAVCTVLCSWWCCLLLSWMRWNLRKFRLIHDSSRQQYWFDNAWRCMYSFVLLMMLPAAVVDEMELT